jgi:CRP/FNR family transcriptional regulator, cyclic AMP receptor protein
MNVALESSVEMMSAAAISLSAPSDDPVESLSALPLFRDLSAKILSAIRESVDVRRYDAGQTVYALGQFDGSEFLVVLSGRMKVSIIEPETGAMLIEEIGEGAIFAMELAFGSAARDAFQQVSVTADNDVVVIAIEAEPFFSLASQRPSLMRNIAAYFAGELATRRFRNMAAEAAPEQRVLTVLLQYVERDAISGHWRVPLMPKHRALAEEAGVEEAASAAAVAMLIQEGIARRDYPGLIIEDISRLNEFAN